MTKAKHFIDLADLSPVHVKEIFTLAASMKAASANNSPGAHELNGKCIGAIFETPSPRTEFALGKGIASCGGHLVKSNGEIKERPHHYARMLGGYFDAAVIKVQNHEILKAIAQSSDIPIINGLTSQSHPVLGLADMLTIGDPSNKKITFVGNVTNIARTYVQAAPLFDFELTLAMPEIVHNQIEASDHIHHSSDPFAAVQDADVIVTDQWGLKEEGMLNLFSKFRVNAELMSHAKDTAIFMHPMPLSGNEQEVTLEVVDSVRSRVFEQSQNRIHGFTAAIAWCLNNS